MPAWFRQAVWIVLGAGCAWGQLSPGPMSKAHKTLSGPTKCTSCHSVSTGGREFRCLGCHSEIRERLSARRGAHPTFVKAVRDQQECVRCHSEHNGPNFVPIRWDVDVKEFDHGKTGYLLEGGHRGLDCRKCHTPKNIGAAERRKLVVKDLTRTYLGLSRECLNCHGDQHRGQLATDCLKCHTPSHWKPASQFDHAQAKFDLTGAHKKLTCDKCHQKVAELGQTTRYKGLAFQTCDGCHKDPHRTAFAAPCKSCHSEEGWKPARTVASQFDHAKTAYPLAGKHAGLVCAKCHATSNFKQPVAHTRCMDCHKTDIHRGQFASRADGGDCSACHVVTGFKPATFNVASHGTVTLPAGGATRRCALRQVPRAGGPGHDLSRQVRPMHGLPRGHPQDAVCGSAAHEPLRRLSHPNRIPAGHFLNCQTCGDSPAAGRSAHGRDLRRMPRPPNGRIAVPRTFSILRLVLYRMSPEPAPAAGRSGRSRPARLRSVSLDAHLAGHIEIQPRCQFLSAHRDAPRRGVRKMPSPGGRRPDRKDGRFPFHTQAVCRLP